MSAAKVRREPCSACPYRADAPSGLWAAEEYAKLPAYDLPTYAQPTETFRCHATPDHYCHGWAVCHGEELLALRLASAQHDEPIEIPPLVVALFPSATAAAAHGLRDMETPTSDSVDAARRLLRKHERLRETNAPSQTLIGGQRDARPVRVRASAGDPLRSRRQVPRTTRLGALRLPAFRARSA